MARATLTLSSSVKSKKAKKTESETKNEKEEKRNEKKEVGSYPTYTHTNKQTEINHQDQTKKGFQTRLSPLFFFGFFLFFFSFFFSPLQYWSSSCFHFRFRSSC
jgi:lipopolysaccharide export LptBFGC system permease protein LptF